MTDPRSGTRNEKNDNSGAPCRETKEMLKTKQNPKMTWICQKDIRTNAKEFIQWNKVYWIITQRIK